MSRSNRSPLVTALDARARDSALRATLRRSLAFDPGTFVPAFRYVEPVLGPDPGEWKRFASYLTAGLWALHWREGRPAAGTVSLSRAAGERAKHHPSIEKRFLTFLDADQGTLPNRSRQMVALLREESIDFDGIHRGLLKWRDEKKAIQIQWAQDFYSVFHPMSPSQDHSDELD